jgi:hypothetical protein
VTELDVSTNLLSDAGAAALGRLLGSSRALRRVSVARNFVTAAGLALLGEGLGGAGALDELVLAPQMEPGSSPPRVSQVRSDFLYCKISISDCVRAPTCCNWHVSCLC